MIPTADERDQSATDEEEDPAFQDFKNTSEFDPNVDADFFAAASTDCGFTARRPHHLVVSIRNQ